MKRRIVSLLMCFVMMFGMLPTAAWAELIPAQGETEEAASNTAYAVGEDTAVQSGEDGIAVMAASANEAEYNGKEYATLAEAFKAAADAPGGTVTVLQDVTLNKADDKGIVLTSGDVTLDLNGKTLTKSATEDRHSGEDYAVFSVKGNSALTIEDSVGGGEIVQLNENPAVLLRGSGTLTVNSGTIKATNTGSDTNVYSYNLVCAVYVCGGTAYINGGTFWGNTMGVVQASDNLHITGGEFYGAKSYALYVSTQKYKENKVLSGGTYTTGVADGYSIWYASYNLADVLLADGYQYADEEGNTLTVEGKSQASGVKGTAKVVPAAGTVEYIGEGGAKQVRTDATELTGNNNKLNDGWYVVTGNVTINDSLIICAETVNLILCDGATLAVDMLEVYGALKQATLNVYLQKDGTGKLTTPLGFSHVGSELTINRIGTPMKMVEIEDETTATDGRNGGFILSKCEHEGLEYTNSDATKHEGTCGLCGTTVSGKHEFGDWKEEDAATHIAICKDCGYKKTANHDFRLIPTGETHLPFCRTCNYKGAQVSHTYAAENDHTCECGTALAATYNGVQYANLETAIKAATTGEGGTVTLARNADASITVSSGEVIIDLGGYTWKNSATPLTVSGGEVTLQNGVLLQSGMTAIGEGNGLVITSGSVTVDAVVISGMARSIDLQGGTLTLGAGATLTNVLKVPDTMKLADCLASGTAFVKCTVNGTTVTPSNPTEYVSDVYTASESDSEISMTVVAHRHSIVNGKPCDCGYACSNDHSKGWGASACPVCGMEASVEVTGADGTAKYFAAFADAITYANGQKNCTVKLRQDVEVSYGTYVTGPLTLDLNGHMVYTDDDDLVVGWSVYEDDGNNNYVLKDTIPGQLILTDSSENKTGAVVSLSLEAGTLDISDAYVPNLECGSSGTVTANGNIRGDSNDNDIYWSISGTLTIKDVTVGYANLYSEDGGSIIIEGGTFGVTYFFTYGGSFAISGGTFAEVVSCGKNNNDKTPLMNLLAKGYAFWSVGKDEAVDASGTTLEDKNVEVRAHTHHIESNGKCRCGVEAVVIDSKGDIYGTLQSALNAATKDSSIKWVQLGQDVTEEVTFNGGEASVTLDMNGKKLTTDAGHPLIVNSGTLTIKGDATIIQATSTAADPRPAVYLTGGTLVFEGVLTAEGGAKQTTHTRQPGVLAEGGVLEFKSAVHLKGGLTMKNTAELRGGLKLGSTFTRGDQEAETRTIDASGSTRYDNLRQLLENDDKMAYQCDNDYQGPTLLQVADTYNWGAGNYTIIAHTHTYMAKGSGDTDWADCACGKTCRHINSTNWSNGVCTLCGVTCLHRDGKVDTETYTCGICKAALAASVSDGTNTTYYVGLADALNAAGNEENGTYTVTLLRDAFMWAINSKGVPLFPNASSLNIAGGAMVTLDLNGFTVAGGSSSDTTTTLNIKAGTLNLTDEKGAGALNRTVINVSGGTLTVNSTVGKIGKLNVSGGTVSLSGGTFGWIDAPNGAKAGDLLAKGYAFKGEGGQFVDYTNSANAMTNVSVVECEHGSVDTTTGVCKYCNTKFAARVMSNYDGTMWYVEKLGSGIYDNTVTLFADSGIVSAGGTCSINLNGHNMTYYVHVKGTTTIMGEGDISQVRLGDVGLKSPGTLRITNDDVTVGTLVVYYNGETKLAHGTFGKITVDSTATTKVTMGALLAEGYAFYGKDGNGAYTVLQKMGETELKDVKVLPHTHTYKDGVCECGDECDVLLVGVKKFDSIQDAVDYILASETREGTILLAKDRAENVTIDTKDETLASKITIDLGGNTWTANLTDGAAHAVLTVAGRYAYEPVVTVQNGTIKQGGTGDTAESAIVIGSHTKLVLGDITVVKGYNGSRMKYAVYMDSTPRSEMLRLEKGSVLIGGAQIGFFSNSLALATWLAEGTTFVQCTYDEESGAVTTDPDTYVNLYNTNFTKENVAVVAHSHTLTAGQCECGYTCPHKNMDADYHCPDCNQTFVAKAVTQVTASTSTTRYAATLEDALTAANGAPVVTLLRNVDLGAERLVVTGDMNASALDLNGHTLSGSGDVVLEIWCNYGLTIRNGTMENTGDGDVILLSRRKDGIFTHDGNLTLDGDVKVIAAKGWAVRVSYTPNAAYGTNPDEAELHIKSGTLQGGLNIGGANVNLGKVQISGGTFIANPNTHSVYYPGSHSSVTGLVGQLKKVLAEGRTYGDANGKAIKYFDEANRTIVDTSNSKWPKGVYLDDTTVTIVEHTSHDIDRDSKSCSICGAPCPHAAWDDDGICTACGDRVMYFKVDDGTMYPDVAKALSAVTDRTDNPVIKMLADCTDQYVSNIGTASGCTLDLNGFRITTSQVIIYKDHVLTIIDSSEKKNGSMGALWADGGRVTIQDGSYAEIIASYADSIRITGEGTVKIRKIQMLGPTGGSNTKVVADLLKPGYAVYLVDESGETATYTIVNGYRNAKNTSSGYLQQYLPGNYKDSIAVLPDGQYYTVLPHEHGFTVSTVKICPNGCGFTCDHSSVGADGTCDRCGTVFTAKVTSADASQTVYYVDLTTALNSAVDGDTVTVMRDASMKGADILGTIDNVKAVTLDLNGHNIDSGSFTISVGNDVAGVASPGKLIVTGTGDIQGIMHVAVFSTLDLSRWTGGTIKSVFVSDNWRFDEATREASLIVGESAGTISKLAYSQWALENVAKTKLSGGTYGEIASATWDVPITPGQALAAGYAFQNADGTFVPYDTTLENYGSSIYNLKVVLCPHEVIEDGRCVYCNEAYAAKVNSTAYKTYGEAQTAWLASGGTLTLYQDVSGMSDTSWTGVSGKTYTLDLNGYKIADGKMYDDGGQYTPSWRITVSDMALTIKDGSEAGDGRLDNLVMSAKGKLTLESGWLGHLTVPSDETVQVTLQGGGLKNYDSEIPLARLLADGYNLGGLRGDLSFKGSGDSSSGIPYAVQKAPAAFGGGKSGTMPNGKNILPFAPTVTMDEGEEEPAKINVAWYLWNGTAAKYLASAELVKTETGWVYDSSKESASYQAYDNLAIGETYHVFAVVKGYGSDSAPLWRAALNGYELTIGKGDLRDAVVELVDAEAMVFAPDTINADHKALEQTQYVQVKLYGETLDAADYVVSGNTGANAGNYKLTVSAAADSALYTGSTEKEWAIAPLPLESAEVQLVKQYDGTTAVDKDAATVFTFRGVDQRLYSDISWLVRGVDYELSDISDNYSAAEQGQYTGLYATVTLKNPNYVFVGGTKVYEWKQTGSGSYWAINHADAPADMNTTLTVMNDHAGTYTLDVSQLLPELAAGCSYGDPTHYLIRTNGTYGDWFVNLDERYYGAETASIDDESGLLTLPIKAVKSSTEESIGTVKVMVSSRNYVAFNIVVTVNTVNKLLPTGEPTLDKTTITYGETLSSIGLSGSMTAGGETVKGTFAWDAPETTPDAQSGYQAAWTFTPEDVQHYQTAHGTARINVDWAELTGVSVKQVGTLTYNGSAQAAQVETKATTVDGTSVKFEYSTIMHANFAAEMPKFTNAGTYTVYYEAIDPAFNHEPVGGSFTVTIEKQKVNVRTPDMPARVYDGTTNAALTELKFYDTAVGMDALVTLDKADYTISNVHFETPDVGTQKRLIFTVTINSGNYILQLLSGKLVTEETYEVTNNTAGQYTITPAALTDVQASAETLTYNGKAQTANVTVTAKTVDNTGVTVTYSAAQNGEYGADVPAFTGAGDHTVYYKVSAKNHEDAYGSVTVVIDPLNITNAEVKLGESLTYNGTEQTQTIASVKVGDVEVTGYTVKNNTGRAAGDYTLTITAGNSNFTGSVEKKFNIGKLNIGNAVITLGESLTYTGLPQTQTIASVKVGELAVDTYDVADAQQVNTGTYTLTVTGTGNFTGTAEKEFTIAPKTILDGDVQVDSRVLTYTGKAQTPQVTVTGLVRDKDYAVAYENNVNAGTGKLTVTGQGNYDGKVEKTFAIGKASLTVTAEDKSVVYGKDAPEFTVAYSGFVNGEDAAVLGGALAFECSYTKGSPVTEFGYAITAKGLTSGNYDITFVGGTLSVVRAEGQVTVAALDAKTYGDAPFALDVDTHGSDGAVTFESSDTDVITVDDAGVVTIVNAGSAVISVKLAKGSNYVAAQTAVTVTVQSKTLTTGDVTRPANVTFDGQPHQWQPVVTDGEKTLAENVDYTVSYDKDDFTNVTGPITVTVTGMGNYTGAVARSYKVTPKAILDGDVQVDGQVLTYTGKAQTPQVTVTGLVRDKDYTVAYENNVNAGTGKLTVTGQGNYDGKVEKTFAIGKASLTVTAEDKSVVYGKDAPEFTVAYSGFVNGEDAAVLGGALAFECSYTKGSPVTEFGYAITAKGLTSGNYDITFVGGTLSVVRAEGQVTVAALDAKTYGDAPFALDVDTHGSDGAVTFESSDTDVITVDDAGVVTIVNAGSAVISVKLARGSNYVAAQTTVEIDVARKDIADAEIELGEGLTYNGSQQTQTVTSVTADGLDVTYTVSGEKRTDAGTYTLTVTGTGNFTGTADKEFTIARKDIAGAEIELGESLTYNGGEQSQTISSVTSDGLDVTYTVSGNSGTEAGMYTLTVTGTGNFTGTAGKAFTIARRDIADAVIGLGEGLTYNGGEQSQTISSVTSDGLDVTYTVSGNSGTEAGTYTLTVAGTGNFTGTAGKAFTIARKDIAGAEIELGESLTYNGGEQSQTISSVTSAGLDVTYTVSGEKRTDAGTYTLTVAGTGNFTGTAGKRFTIAPMDISNAVVTAADVVYNGTAQTTVITSVEADGLVLGSGDYTAAIRSAVSVGVYPLTVTGQDNFTGTAKGTFAIVKAAAPAVNVRLDVTNGYAAVYTVDLRATLDQALPAGSSFGTLRYGAVSFADSMGYCDAAETAVSANGVLTLPVKAVDTGAEGQAATVTVAVSSGNFEDMAVTVTLYAVNKTVPSGKPNPSHTRLNYGEALNSVTLSGNMWDDGKFVPGTFAWKEPNLRPAVGSYTAEWVFNPASGKYAAVTGTIELTVIQPVEPTYTVGGIVKAYSITGSGSETLISGAVVTIRKGLDILGGQKLTDENGVFSLEGVVAGVYNVVVEYNGKTVTQKVEITDHNVDGLVVAIPQEDVNSQLDIKSSGGVTDEAVVGGLDKEAGEQFKDEGGTDPSGGSVSVKMELEEKPEDKNDAAQNAIREILKDKVTDFIDMSLTLVQNGVKKDLTETKSVLEIIISYDTSRSGITVVRHHGDTVETFERLSDLSDGRDMTFYVDTENRCIHIFASKFSTYAISSETQNGGSGSSGGSVVTGGNSSPATGDVGLLPYAALALSGCTGIVLTFRRKRKDD